MEIEVNLQKLKCSDPFVLMAENPQAPKILALRYFP